MTYPCRIGSWIQFHIHTLARPASKSHGIFVEAALISNPKDLDPSAPFLQFSVKFLGGVYVAGSSTRCFYKGVDQKRGIRGVLVGGMDFQSSKVTGGHIVVKPRFLVVQRDGIKFPFALRLSAFDRWPSNDTNGIAEGVGVELWFRAEAFIDELC